MAVDYPRLRQALSSDCAIRPGTPVLTDFVSKSTLSNWKQQGLVQRDVDGDHMLTAQGARVLGYSPRFPGFVERMLNWINRPLHP